MPVPINSGPKIDLKKISQRLSDINLTSKAENQETAEVSNSQSVGSTAAAATATATTTSAFEDEMILSLQRHSEHLINTDEWPQWRFFLDFLNTSNNQQFRKLFDFPIGDKYVLIRETHENLLDNSSESVYQRIKELRVAVIGNVDAGKSTMLGVLSRGGLDDGRGRARFHCARHRHESETGRTSSVSQELLGYTISGAHINDEREDTSNNDNCSNSNNNNSNYTNNNGLNYNSSALLHKHHKISWEVRVGRDSWKCISLIDLAGHERYLKTTMFGLTGYCPDLAMLMVGANTGGLIGTSKEHLALAAALAIPTIVVITKIDLAPEAVRSSTLAHINKMLKTPTCKKMPLVIRGVPDVIHTIKSGLLAANQICPIFEVSNVTGQGIDLLRLFFNLVRVPDSIRERWEAHAHDPTEYQINETYTVPGVGTVVSGVITSGKIKIGDQLHLGPVDNHGKFIPTTIRGIQRKRINLSSGSTGQAVSLALKKIKRSEIRYGMVLVSPNIVSTYTSSTMSTSTCNNAITSSSSRVCREFTAQVVILYHSTTITSKYQAMLHCGTIRQTVQIVSMTVEDDSSTATTTSSSLSSAAVSNGHNDAVVGRTGDRAKIRFRFLKQPEMMRVGTKILFREGRTRGIGKIIELH